MTSILYPKWLSNTYAFSRSSLIKYAALTKRFNVLSIRESEHLFLIIKVFNFYIIDSVIFIEFVIGNFFVVISRFRSNCFFESSIWYLTNYNVCVLRIFQQFIVVVFFYLWCSISYWTIAFINLKQFYIMRLCTNMW